MSADWFPIIGLRPVSSYYNGNDAYRSRKEEVLTGGSINLDEMCIQVQEAVNHFTRRSSDRS